MRRIFRFLGLLFAAGAFVSFVIDGSQSIADGAIHPTPTGAIWTEVSLQSLVAFQTAVKTYVSPVLWDMLLFPLLRVPFFILLIALSALCFFIGRPPRSQIGYATRG